MDHQYVPSVTRGSALIAGWLFLVPGMSAAAYAGQSSPAPTGISGVAAVVSLDADDWLLATDPRNVGRVEGWQSGPRPQAKRAKVPWIIQGPFPGYHGVAWYWRDFPAPVNPHPRGRYLLRFWAVDYMSEVWLNGLAVGKHEGGETPFVLDVTRAIKPGSSNRLAVRVLNPTHQPIDGIVLNETPHRNKALPYSPGSAWDQGGIMDSVELLLAPAVRLADLCVRPDWKSGAIRVRAGVSNTAEPVQGQVEITVAPAAGGTALIRESIACPLPGGESTIEKEVLLAHPRAWELSDPFLYRVTARLRTEGGDSSDEHSVNCGFRDFRFQQGAFRLNGRRIYLRSSHTGNCCPIGLEMPYDPDYLRRDLINAKAMGFNTIRFIAGVAKRYQLDLCDQIGLMVYEESYAGWCLADSPKMAQRYNESVSGMVRRDGNHPSVIMWGLLNETSDGPVFRHAVAFLPALRQLDDSRIVMLNSGRFDNAGGLAEIEAWHNAERTDPCVTRNGTTHTIQGLGITWLPGQLAFHPGRDGEYAVVRWTAPAADQVELAAAFRSIAERATTDVHVLHNGRALFNGFINLHGSGMETKFAKALRVRAGDTIDCVCGYGNGDYGADTTALSVRVKSSAGKMCDAAAEFSSKRNPNGAWSYGQLRPSPAPKAETFTLFRQGVAETSIGSLSNPGSNVWEDVLSDQHPYQRVPHTAAIIHTLRTLGGDGRPVFLSEYGIGSAVDLWRAVRNYEQRGKDGADDARFYRVQLDRFLADWERWKMADVFSRPEEFFAASNARMASQRLLGLNAIRSNPNVIGHSLTGTVDQGMTGEGLWTTFREFKPGTMDAVFDGWAPLRWCLFAEPVNVYRKSPVRLEAVLANEDVLAPGRYPARLQVVGPGNTRVLDRRITLTIPDRQKNPQPPMVMPVFAEDLLIDGPPGKYRFLATFERGAAAAGGPAEFYVADPAEMPPVHPEVVLWGNDPALGQWLREHAIRTRAFSPAPAKAREVILASVPPPAGERPAAFRELAVRMARGSAVVFLSPDLFAGGQRGTAWLPLPRKGAVAVLPSWLYHKDEWAKRHPIFAGLPCGGLMDYTFYRELVPDRAWVDLDPPTEAVAGAIDASCGYSSGLLVAVYRLGAGKFLLNTLLIRENLGRHPAAERLLRNMLNYAAQDADKPLAELPAGFEGQLKAIGYGD